MSDRPGGEPTEAPTEKRLKKAREDGKVAYSAKVAGVFQISVFLLLGFATFSLMARGLQEAAVVLFSGDLPPGVALRFSLNALLNAFLPLGVALFLALLAAGLVQVGFRFNIKSLQPKLSRISPKEGFKRIFSRERLVELVMGLCAVILTGVILYFHLRDNMGRFLQLGLSGFPGAMVALPRLLLGFLLKMCFVFAAVAALDWFMIYRRHSKSLMMTRYEVQKEMEQAEGNPHQKSERQRVHLELSHMGLGAAVAQSSAVIVNPTHIAVALIRYGDRVYLSAVGKDEAAARIRYYARLHGVPLFVLKPLARSLSALSPGAPVPRALATSLEVLLLSLERYGG
ncbi:EscU/YscU/HrcU family type III secretion system export apparatus switch protein [Myxococcota bacterium]|nr:EscU/YscU/HrcU family type III secretion system export apparatus switch protein [Myxococcota bacterium]MBU1536251.1 EscU/YscU/HrcU family type III secretion system export apparatus switch protein [Myxococcota bacterium]